MKTPDDFEKHFLPETHYSIKTHLELLRELYKNPGSKENKIQDQAGEETCKKI